MSIGKRDKSIAIDEDAHRRSRQLQKQSPAAETPFNSDNDIPPPPNQKAWKAKPGAHDEEDATLPRRVPVKSKGKAKARASDAESLPSDGDEQDNAQASDVEYDEHGGRESDEDLTYTQVAQDVSASNYSLCIY